MNYLIKTQGLMCAHCEAKVETALLNIDGVTNAEASHEDQTIEVSCSTSISPKELTQAIESAGTNFYVLAIEEHN